MSKCLFCSTEITIANDSDEHIIPNSIGGKVVIRGFLCRKCNSETGDRWDVELSKQLNLFCLLLGGVKRDRGVTPNEVFKTISGKDVRLAHEGVMSIAHPKYTSTQEGNKTHFTFTAGNLKQAQQFVRDFCKKHTSLNQQELMQDLVSSKEYLEGDALIFNPKFGGEDAGKSLVKTILAYASKLGVNPISCNKAIDYLLNNGEPCFGYYYNHDVVVSRCFEKPAHCLAIHADPSTGYVVGYLEYFGVWRVISLISDTYNGKEIKGSYFIYPEDSKTGSFDFILPLDIDTINASYNYELYDEKKLHEAFAFFLNYCQRKDYERERDIIIRQAWNDSLEQMGLKEGDIPTDEQKLELSKKIAAAVTPFLMSQLSKKIGR